MRDSITLINLAADVYAAHASPPLWLAYLQAVLKRQGIAVKPIDQQAGQQIEGIDSEWVGLSVCTPAAAKAFALSDDLRRQGKKVVMGGPHATIFPNECLQHADKVIVGEGENSILRVFESREKILHSELIKDLDTLPFPDWSGLPLHEYKAVTRKHNYLSVMSSRGCPFSCIYCFKGVFGNTYRKRSSANVLSEIGYLIENYGVKEIGFVDDNFSLDKKRVEEICKGMIERRFKILWNCPNGVRVDSVDPQLLRLMHNAGCYQLSFGIESGNQAVLDKIGKRINLQQVRDAVRWAKEAGIETIGFFMIALPFDDMQTMQETIDFAKELDLDLIQFTITTPYPGTQLYDLVEKQGKFLIKDFSKYGSYTGKAYYEYGCLNRELVESMYKKAYKSVYLRPGYALKRIAKNPKLLASGAKYLLSVLGKKKN